MHEVPRDGSSCRRSEQKGGCFVLKGWKRGLVRTKYGVFCAEELEKGTCQNKMGVFCAEGLEKGICQNKIGDVLC